MSIGVSAIWPPVGVLRAGSIVTRSAPAPLIVRLLAIVSASVPTAPVPST